MDVYDSPSRDLPAEGVGLLGKALALIALGAVLAEAWRSVRSTHERRLSEPGAGQDDQVPAWEGDAVGSDLTGGGAARTGGLGAGGIGVGATGRGGPGSTRVGGRADDDFGGGDLPTPGITPTTHH